ncbi:hypothetical protein NDU88_001046 [Pleurodeles waltl]|uniref:Uncharacterized protein n=1 Tax=Pleurodeles waltl TaxID=8319 RepID=A0AAV7SYW4_PLEWA|nr:hypothetical protein NDU88_001046 [Pleurodeles waltl]
MLSRRAVSVWKRESIALNPALSYDIIIAVLLRCVGAVDPTAASESIGLSRSRRLEILEASNDSCLWRGSPRPRISYGNTQYGLGPKLCRHYKGGLQQAVPVVECRIWGPGDMAQAVSVRSGEMAPAPSK